MMRPLRKSALENHLERGGGFRTLGGGGGGAAVPAWTSPAEATSASLRGWWQAGSVGETYSGGLVTSSPDLSGTGNTMAVPAGIGTATGPTYLATGYRGLPAWRFNGTTDALARSTLSCLPAGGGAYTFVWFGQRQVVTASQRFMAFQNDRPFINTSGEDTAAWAADGAFSTAGTVNVDGLMGPSLLICTFDPTADRQRLYIDAPQSLGWVKLIGETANTDPGSSLNGGTMGFGYNGHPTVGTSYYEGIIRGGCLYRGELSAADCAQLSRWWAGQQGTRRGRLLLLWLGQSNERADQATNFARRVVRRDVNAIRDSSNYDSSGREQQAWAALNDTVLAGSLRGADIETVYQLVDDLGIDCDLVNVAKSGTGFELPAGGGLDSTGWASPTTFGGDGALMWTRFRTAMDSALAQGASYTAIHAHIGQKETDGLSGSGTAGFEDRLVDEIADLRSEYGASITVSLPLLNPGATGVTNNLAIRAAQEAVEAGVADVFGVDCDDQSIRVDGFHYEVPYHVALGERVAAHIDTLIP